MPFPMIPSEIEGLGTSCDHVCVLRFYRNNTGML